MKLQKAVVKGTKIVSLGYEMLRIIMVLDNVKVPPTYCQKRWQYGVDEV
jgi:hypothetical protein